MSRPKPLVLIILDGWGYRAETKANAIALARKPTYHRLLREYPNTLIHQRAVCRAAGRADGQQRSRPSEYGRRAHRAYGHHTHRPDDPERRIFLASCARRGDEECSRWRAQVASVRAGVGRWRALAAG